MFAAIMCLAASGLHARTASDADSIWNRSVEYYSEGDYANALEGFISLENQGYLSADLYYNIANCYYKAGGYTGKAIVYYQRALRIDPSFEDARVNLAFARNSALDRIEPVPEFVMVTWLRDLRDALTADSWAWMFFIFLLSAAVAVLLFVYAPRPDLRKVSFALSIVLVIFSASSLAFTLSSNAWRNSRDGAVVISPVTSVKSSPAEMAPPLFVIHEGTDVDIIETVGDWDRIELADGRQGWLRASDIEII